MFYNGPRKGHLPQILFDPFWNTLKQIMEQVYSDYPAQINGVAWQRETYLQSHRLAINQGVNNMKELYNKNGKDSE